ncbi:nucleoprotein TPR [Biomphalaria glabrata]|nr:nucleoprotein TPR [Biomphalaria glabrata]
MMATVASTSRPASATNLTLLPIPPQLPFPTHPSLPDRVSRLKRLNLAMTSRDSLDYESALKLKGSFLEPSMDYEVKHSDLERSRNNFRGGQGYIRRIHGNSFDKHSQSSSHMSDSVDQINSLTDSTSLRRSQRNIVTPRHYRQPGQASVRGTRRSRSRTGSRRLRLPSITVSKPEDDEQGHPGIFLTSLNYEESPMPTERLPSTPSSATSDSRRMGDKAPSDVSAAREANASRDPLPALITTSREPPATQRTSLALSTVGLQRVYLEGLDYMRSHVTNVEEEAERVKREFHKVDEERFGDYFPYLKQINELLLQANSTLRRNKIPLEVIDSDTRLVKLLNQLREDPTPDMMAVDTLTTFWTEVKTSAHTLQCLLEKFHSTVFQRLSNNYIGGNSAEILVPVCQQYALDIEDFLKDMDNQMTNARLVLKSFDSGLHRDLMDKNAFSERLVVLCDTKAFPVLGLVHDVCDKIVRMCATARQWLARDERFMHEISSFIRETRTATRKREQVLQTEKQKQKRVEKNVRVAQNLLQRNKEKLQLIEADLQELEEKLNTSREEQRTRMNMIQQKENMVDFLKVTAQQTKRNYSLQSKRSKLLRQVKDLEDYLRAMESELEVVQDQILAKSHEKILLTHKINTSEQSYGALRSDLDKVSENLEDLEAEVTGLSSQLLQLEIVHTIKTSPETLDNLIDRPSTVKLSKSLKERIKERKKKAAMK